ncbi:MAG: dienelactone hydrolase family protein [Bdellovibrionaceae bacterium]|nr:dienelactone hydrolase family protein [Pseudobdellovibrionaceae bacterium]
MRILLLVLISVSLQACSTASKNNDNWVDYTVENVTHKGYIAAPKSLEKKPAVIIVHEWWGHNDYARSRADQLAKEGYVAMSLDMYGDGKLANHPKDAGELSGMVMKNPDLAEKKFRAALEILKARPDVDSSNIAAIGYCFGGAVVLEMAKRGLPLKGVVSVHGMLSTPTVAQKGKTNAKVLVLNGASDIFITAKDIDGFKKEMDKAKVQYEFVNLPGAKHGFSNPKATENGKKFGIPLEYSSEADKSSWAKSNSFLNTIFK